MGISLYLILALLIKPVSFVDLNFYLPRFWKHGIMYTWNNLDIEGRIFTRNASECLERCRARPLCGYFSFFPHRNDSDNCELKKMIASPTCRIDKDPMVPISGTRYSEDAGNNFNKVLAYVKKTKNHCLCLTHSFYCPGTVFEVHNSTYSTKVCNSFCLDDPRCIYYLADGNNCYLYSDINKKFCRRQENSIFGSVSCYEKDKNELLLVSRLYSRSYRDFFNSPLIFALLITELLVIIYIVTVNYVNTSSSEKKRILKAPEGINAILELVQAFIIYSGLIYNANFTAKRMNVSELPLIASIGKILVHISVNSASILRIFYMNYNKEYDKKDTLLIILSIIFGAHIFIVTNFVKSLSFQSTDFYFFLSAIKGVILLTLSLVIRHYLPPFPRNLFYYLPLIVEGIYILSNVLNSGFVIWERIKNDKLMNYSKSVMEENKKDIVLP